MNFDRRLVWILGSPRSGSTWLMQLLSQHDAVVPIDEPLIGWYLGPFLCDLPGGDSEALTADNFTLRQVQRGKASSFFADDYAEVWAPAVGRLIRERLFVHACRHQAATRQRRRIVVVKEPNGSQSADLLAHALPRSRIIFLLRDGRDVVDSELAANLEGSWVSREFPGLRGIREADRSAFVRQSAHKWLWRTQMVQNAVASHPGPVHVLRYEDLIADTQRKVSELLSWLELTADESSLQQCVMRNSFEQLSAGRTGDREFFRSATPGAWRRNLRESEQADLARILGPKLAELGYD